MSTHLVTFASQGYLRSANLCVESARAHGVDGASIVTPAESTDERGFGFWRWKPSVILDRMSLPEGNFLPVLNDGDILIYSDSGVEFINNVNFTIDRMGHEKPQDDIWLFGNNWGHAHWCKADTAAQVWANTDGPVDTLDLDWGRFGKQVQASVIFFRVSDYTRQFVAEWLKWCLFEGGRLIDDSPSRAPNHPEFQEHRHDQAILTTLAYREGVKLHWWGARYNMAQQGGGFVYDKLSEYAADTYEPFVHHHRRRDSEWPK